MKRKKIVIFGGIFFFIIGVIVVSQPVLIKALLAKYKSTDHFVTLFEDPRIHYESSAKDNALLLHDVLEEQINSVEEALDVPFKKPIEILNNRGQSKIKYGILKEVKRAARKVG